MSDTPPPTASSSTANLTAARDHARAQAATAGGSGPSMPATTAADLPAGVDASEVVWDEPLPGWNYVSHPLAAGTRLRIEDTDGAACVQLLLFSALNSAERLNVADTVKVQWQAYLGDGAVLLSDMGRSLATIVEDSSNNHDCLCGTTNRASAAGADGGASGPRPNGRDLLVLGAAKLGLGRVDVGPCVNLFTGVRVDDDGSLELVAPAGPSAVTLRFDQDVLVVLANVPHPLAAADAVPATVRCTAWRGSGGPSEDRSPTGAETPERERAYLNTDALIAGVAR